MCPHAPRTYSGRMRNDARRNQQPVVVALVVLGLTLAVLILRLIADAQWWWLWGWQQ